MRAQGTVWLSALWVGPTVSPFNLLLARVYEQGPPSWAQNSDRLRPHYRAFTGAESNNPGVVPQASHSLWGALGAKGVATPSWPQGCSFPVQLWPAMDPTSTCWFPLAELRWKPFAWTSRVANRVVNIEKTRDINPAEGLCSPPRLWLNLMPKGLTAGTPKGSLTGLWAFSWWRCHFATL